MAVENESVKTIKILGCCLLNQFIFQKRTKEDLYKIKPNNPKQLTSAYTLNLSYYKILTYNSQYRLVISILGLISYSIIFVV